MADINPNPEKKKDKRSRGRKNLPVVASWSDKQITSFWRTHCRTIRQISNDGSLIPFSPCDIWTGSVNAGYPVVSMGHAKSKPKMHQVAAFIKFGKVAGPSETTSHLCHRKLCVNPDHLCIESIGHNSWRNGCQAYLKDSIGVVWTICPHKPQCLCADTDNLNGFNPYPVQ